MNRATIIFLAAVISGIGPGCMSGSQYLALTEISDEEATGLHEYTASSLKAHVVELARDEYEGRGAGYAGELKAAMYIAEQFEAMGLEPYDPSIKGWEGYVQNFDMHTLDGPIPWEIRQSRNVIGILPGTSPSEGYIIIGGHYDGQGRTGQADLGRGISEGDPNHGVENGDNIWNSAVDNAVSIASIIEIAQAMKQVDPPRRTIVFVAFGAEESALDGSIFLANHPVERLGAPKAMINLEKLVGDPDADFLYVSYGTSDVFPRVTERTVSETGVELVPFYPGVIANTDHYGFILRGVPAITVGTGSVNNVHTSLDHAALLDYELLAKRTRFVSSYLSNLASIDDPMTFSGDIEAHYGVTGGPATAAEKTALSFEGGATFKVSAVVDGSLAGKSGILPGDLIIAVNEAPVPEQDFYQGLENLFDDDTSCEEKRLTLIRGSEVKHIVLPATCREG